MKKIIDAHLHCGVKKGSEGFIIEQLKGKMEEHHIAKAILYLIDEMDYTNENFAIYYNNNIIPSVMLNPKDLEVEDKLLKLQKKGIKILKILPYEQRLFYEDFHLVCDYAMKAQKYGMALTVCGSYGSKDIYHTNGVELAAEILNAGFSFPLIIAHGGMTRLLDVYSLMREYHNLYIDISFTIPFWWESHVIQDLYFVIKQLKYERVFWGSDYPYHTFEDAFTYFDLFCKKYQLSVEQKEKILFSNFENFYLEFLK